MLLTACYMLLHPDKKVGGFVTENSPGKLMTPTSQRSSAIFSNMDKSLLRSRCAHPLPGHQADDRRVGGNLDGFELIAFPMDPQTFSGSI